jgi:hypothetical protein
VSKLESDGVEGNLIKPMLAHKVRGFEYHYSSHKASELLENFKNALSWLIPKSVEEVEAYSKKKLEEERSERTKLEYEHIKLKSEFTSLHNQQEDLSKSFEDLNDYVMKLPVLSEAIKDPERKAELLKMLSDWRMEDEAKANDDERTFHARIAAEEERKKRRKQ